MLIRPRRFVPPAQMLQFWRMVCRPAAGVALALKSQPELSRLVVGLAAAGLARGALEGLWYFLMTGRGGELVSLVGRAEWVARYGVPFLLLKMVSPHLLWFASGGVLHLACRALGGPGSFRRVLQATGIAAYGVLGAGLISYIHLILPLPSSPIAIGHVVLFLWLAVVFYETARQVHELPPLGAALAAAAPVLVGVALHLGTAGFFFRLMPLLPPGDWHPGDWLARY